MRATKKVLLFMAATAVSSCSEQPADEGRGCDAGAKYCEGQCVFPLADDRNCGACGVMCGPGEACAAGTCFPLDCSNAACSPRQVCVDATCTERSCISVSCDPGTDCYDGACYPDACDGVPCPTGQLCIQGACYDSACEGVTCQAPKVCMSGACLDPGCDDGLQSGEESDVDCGASCTPCANGKKCGTPADCASQVCNDGFCSAMTISISPSTVVLPVNGTTTFSASGGVLPYVFSKPAGAGSVTQAGVYTAPATAGSAIVRVTDAEGNTADAGVTIGVPPSCTLTAAPASISQGGSSVLTANCSPAASSYAWTGGTCAGTTGVTCTVTPATTTTYAVSGTNSFGSGGPASATVTVSTIPEGCAITPVTWPSGLAAYAGGTPKQAINPGELQAFSLTQATRTAGHIRISYGQCNLEYSVSLNPCDWSSSLQPLNCYSAGIDPTIVVQTSDQPPLAGVCVVEPNQVFYLNVREVVGMEHINCTYYLSW